MFLRDLCFWSRKRQQKGDVLGRTHLHLGQGSHPPFASQHVLQGGRGRGSRVVTLEIR